MRIFSRQAWRQTIFTLVLSQSMPSMHLTMVAKRFDGYRQTLDKKRRDVFDYLLFELAGRREETLVNHPQHSEAALWNILIEQEMRIRRLEDSKDKSS